MLLLAETKIGWLIVRLRRATGRLAEASDGEDVAFGRDEDRLVGASEQLVELKQVLGIYGRSDCRAARVFDVQDVDEACEQLIRSSDTIGYIGDSVKQQAIPLVKVGGIQASACGNGEDGRSHLILVDL
jgi:hypothetical protein